MGNVTRGYLGRKGNSMTDVKFGLWQLKSTELLRLKGYIESGQPLCLSGSFKNTKGHP